ncbi:Spc98 family-domain-containing protein [Lasiosphaeria ovina]|uniref:Spindle pole body component n=1 Tax=Lasiosphaeria ovina TaxID=92902 RepID=A0AAE0KC76_9PEZI|nr:Spc98 family-domain-containing protein [Lasiosphaeria ovina]
MAYLEQLGALTDELIAAVGTLPESAPERLDAARESALRTLRHHNFLRTNQFEVRDRLNGLEERFHVVGRDALAKALSKRLRALEPFEDKHTPDILHFILELSDRPAHNSKLSDLERLAAPETDSLYKLTWKDIAREDGWHEDSALWRDIDYSPSSDEDDQDDAHSAVSSESLTSASSVPDSYRRTAHDLVINPPGGKLLLDQVRESQAWRDAAPATGADGRSKKTPITTSQLLREALFMLGGLETTLFDSSCNFIPVYQLSGVSWDTYKALASSFAECGRKLAPLRAFIKTKEDVPLLQVFQDSLQRALRSFDGQLAAIQSRLVAVEQDVPVSLIGLLPELRPSLIPLYVLSSIVCQLQEERNAHAFRYLELLFDAAGTAQMEGSDGTYKLLGGIFFDCLQVYLKPIRLWMEEGRLLPGDRTFFVSEASTRPPLPQIWRSQFNLRRTPEGNLHAPRFLRPAIHRIFTAGKSIVVLKHLKHHESARSRRDKAEPKMDFATVCPDHLEFAPFSELFGAGFHAWIQSKHHTASATLRELLFSGFGLSRGLDALQSIYLMSDGSRSDAFAEAVFRHLDSFSASWRDRFTLTEIAQEAFSSSVDTYRLSAEISPRAGLPHSAVASRSSVRLSLPVIRLIYRLDWPVQIVISEESVQGYQAIFTFLLQARRAFFVLKHPILGSSHTSSDGGGAVNDHLARSYYSLRSKLLWFCNTVMTYLTTLVLAPNTDRLRQGLRDAADVDDMITVHSEFVTRVVNESLQGPKLQPIRDCMLDMFDLALKVEDARRTETARHDEEDQEISRLSVMSSPVKTPANKGKKAVRRTEDDDDDDEEDENERQPDWGSVVGQGAGGVSGKPYALALGEMHADFERHLRFVAGGLRGVGRASRDEAAGKWDLLAEMLEVGIRGD